MKFRELLLCLAGLVALVVFLITPPSKFEEVGNKLIPLGVATKPAIAPAPPVPKAAAAVTVSAPTPTPTKTIQQLWDEACAYFESAHEGVNCAEEPWASCFGTEHMWNCLRDLAQNLPMFTPTAAPATTATPPATATTVGKTTLTATPTATPTAALEAVEKPRVGVTFEPPDTIRVDVAVKVTPVVPMPKGLGIYGAPAYPVLFLALIGLLWLGFKALERALE